MKKLKLVFIILLGIISACNSQSGSHNLPDNLSSDYTDYSHDSKTIDIIDYIALEDIEDGPTSHDHFEIVEFDSDLKDEQTLMDLIYVQDIADNNFDIEPALDLTPESIGFESISLPHKGSLIFYNNWAIGDGKDSIEMISPDGNYKTIRMYANRVWSFDVNKKGDLIVFSTSDPYQSERYGINTIDAIQNSWLVRGNSLPSQISFGPVNDECHNFISDELLMMCRRANFKPDPQYYITNDPYRIILHNLISNEEEFITPLDNRYNDYYGSIRSDGLILFNRNTIAERTIDIMLLDILSQSIDLLLEDANGPVISYDGLEVLYKRKGQNKIFLSSSYNLTEGTAVVDGGSRGIGRYVFSPDKKMIAYTLEDRQNNCYDLMIISRDGSNPEKILDCSDEKKFITVIQWIEVQ